MEGVEMKGMGSGWSWQTCQLYTTPGFQTFSSGKVMLCLWFYIVNLGREASPAWSAGEVTENFKVSNVWYKTICNQCVSEGAAGQGSEPREGTMDDDYDQDDHIYAVYSVM